MMGSMRTTIRLIILLCVLGAGCTAPPGPAADGFEPEPRPAETGVEPGQLLGIQQVLLNDDGSVTLVKESDSGLVMYDQAGDAVDAVTLRVGRQARLSDGRQVTITYELLDITNYELTFRTTGQFDARALGGQLRTYQKTITIFPYQRQPELWP